MKEKIDVELMRRYKRLVGIEGPIYDKVFNLIANMQENPDKIPTLKGIISNIIDIYGDNDLTKYLSYCINGGNQNSVKILGETVAASEESDMNIVLLRWLGSLKKYDSGFNDYLEEVITTKKALAQGRVSQTETESTYRVAITALNEHNKNIGGYIDAIIKGKDITKLESKLKKELHDSLIKKNE